MNSRNDPGEAVQESYARLLVWLVRVGLALLFLTFLIYALGLLPAQVDLETVPQLWHLSAEEYIETTEKETGWNWVGSLNQGNVLVFGALVLFPAGTMLLLGVAAVLYFRKGVPAYAVISFLELLVLLVAAAGILSTGH